MSEFVTREEFEAFKRTQEERLTPMAVRLEVISHDTTRLTRAAAEIREEMNERFDAIDARFESVDARFERLEKQISDGNAALLSAVLQLGKKP